MKYLLLIFVIIFLSCSNNNQENQSLIKENTQLIDTVKAELKNNVQCQLGHTILKAEAISVQLESIDSQKYELIWEGDDFSRTYPKQFNCWLSSNGDTCDWTPILLEYTTDYVLLKVPTATTNANLCYAAIEWKVIYLPLNEEETPFEVEYFLKVIDGYAFSTNSVDTFIVTNLSTRKSESFELSPVPYFVFRSIDYSIGEIEFLDRKCRIEYMVGTDEDNGYTERIFDVRI